MKTIVPMMALMVVALLVAPALGGNDATSQRTFYEVAVDEEIVKSRQMASLMTSRSANLRMKGHREASKAMFLETHRDRLVDDMMAQGLEPKAYKVDRFLNDRFGCTCYATWAAVGN
jgi:hypothetical protein